MNEDVRNVNKKRNIKDLRTPPSNPVTKLWKDKEFYSTFKGRVVTKPIQGG